MSKKRMKIQKALELFRPKKIIPWYSKRYKVSIEDAKVELMQLGFYDEVMIECYENDGVDWIYMEDGYTGDTKVVPKGTEECDLYMF